MVYYTHCNTELLLLCLEQIGAQTSVKTVGVDAASYLKEPSPSKLLAPYEGEYISKTWEFVKEPTGVWSASNFTYQGILEHLNVTKDQSDYLWYSTRFVILLNS